MGKSQFFQEIYHFSQELPANRLWLLLICLQLARVRQIFSVNESWPMDCSQPHGCSNCFNIPALTFKMRRLWSSHSYNRYSFIPKVMRNVPFRQKIAIEIFLSFKTKQSKSETDLWHWQKGREEIEKILINEIYLCCGWWSKGTECNVQHSPLLLKPKFLWCAAQYPAITGIKRKSHENIVNKGLNWTASGTRLILPRFLLFKWPAGE